MSKRMKTRGAANAASPVNSVRPGKSKFQENTTCNASPQFILVASLLARVCQREISRIRVWLAAWHRVNVEDGK